jgi:acyl-CoA synthetase (AMP-forming)/AMP-acid ligase II
MNYKWGMVKSNLKQKPGYTDDGWFKTGDVSTIDQDGYMEIKDRTKDLIKVEANGFRVAFRICIDGTP